MRRSLPLRIFTVQLIFTVGAAALAVYLVRRSFVEYGERWRREVESLRTELPLQPLVNEVAAAFLRRIQEPLPEQQEEARKRIAEGLGSLLKGVPSIQTLIVVDSELRIQYASDKSVLDLGYTNPQYKEFLSSDTESRRKVQSGGKNLSEIVWPIFDIPWTGEWVGPPIRLGSVLVRYRTDLPIGESIGARLVEVPDVSWRSLAQPLLPFLFAAVAAGLLVAAFTAYPVRRLVRALESYKARGYRGELDVAGLGLGGELASAARTIHEMGGRLSALDERGREREALLETLSQSLEEGMLVLGPSGEPVAWNQAALRLLGVVPAQGGSAPGAPGIGEALARQRALAAALREIAEGGGAEVDLERPDGATVPVRLTSVAFEVRPGERGTLLLMRDLAFVRKVETHLLEAGRFATLAHLAGALAHEIRNPLNSIGLNAGALELHLRNGSTDPRRVATMQESVSTILEETRRLTDLLNNYLGLLRSSPVEGQVDLRDLCRRVARLLRYTAIRSRVEIRLEGDETLPPVRGVPDRLQQAVLNLVLNAIQAMPEGGVVRLATRADSGVVRLTVIDTGPGLPPEVEKSLFQTGVTSKPGGTGLGLPLVKMIAESHGGSVWYRSSPGEGTAFTLVLPARAAA